MGKTRSSVFEFGCNPVAAKGNRSSRGSLAIKNRYFTIHHDYIVYILKQKLEAVGSGTPSSPVYQQKKDTFFFFTCLDAHTNIQFLHTRIHAHIYMHTRTRTFRHRIAPVGSRISPMDWSWFFQDRRKDLCTLWFHQTVGKSPN